MDYALADPLGSYPVSAPIVPIYDQKAPLAVGP